MQKKHNQMKSIIKGLNMSILVMLIICFMPTTSDAAGGYWQLIYSTDFSTDPGWTTNNPSRYYWVSSDSTYYMETVMGSSDYTYINTGWNQNSLQIVYDVNLSQEQWGSRLGLGIYDTLMHEDISDYLEPHFGHDDGGKEACIHYSHQSGGGAPMHYGNYMLNTWYNFELTYDKSSNTATLIVKERDTGIQFCIINATGLGTFVGLTKLGFSMIGTTSYGTAFKGKIDNVFYYNWYDYIPAIVDIHPKTLNLKSHGKWMTCYIELPDGHSVEDIDLSTVAMTAIDDEPLDPPLYREGPVGIGDEDEDGIPDLMVKFDRQDLIAILEEMVETPVDVKLTVSGELIDDTPFEGSDVVQVIHGREDTRVKLAAGPMTEKQTGVPSSFVLNECEPNPFSAQTSIRYALPLNSHVRIEIMDVSGRVVAILLDDVMNAGHHVVNWDGCDNTGKAVSSGVYFMRFKAGDHKDTEKLILLR